MQARLFNNQYNTFVSIFLRTLEYYRGIMFLTTNRVKDFNNAIQNKISVTLYYSPLGLNTKKTI